MPRRVLKRSKLYVDLCLPHPPGLPIRERLIQAFEDFVEFHADDGYPIPPHHWIGLKSIQGVAPGGRGTYHVDNEREATLIAVEIYESAAPGPLSDFEDPSQEPVF